MSVRVLFFFHAFGWPTPGFSRTAEHGIIAALGAGVPDIIMFAFTGADDSNCAIATRAGVFFTDRHDLNMALLGRDVMHHNRFAVGTDHGDGITGFEGFSLLPGLYFIERLADFGRGSYAIITGWFVLSL